jgi:hypothetical protein
MNNEERNIERRADEEIRADERPLAERTPVPGAEGMPDARGEAVVMQGKSPSPPTISSLRTKMETNWAQ